MRVAFPFGRTLRALIVLAPLLLVAAKCIENDALYRDEAGDWHVVGEIHNETDVQGVEMMLGGTLFDASGNVLATAQAPICPFELSPHTFSVFDVQFFNSANVEEPDRYEIHAVGGRALPAALPPLDVSLTNFTASRAGDTVTLIGTIRMRAAYSGEFSGCVAFYDGGGRVMRQVTVIGFGALPKDKPQELHLPLPLIPDDAVTVRFWLVGPGSEPFKSDYAAATTPAFDIE
jgi:hypothetical protein